MRRFLPVSFLVLIVTSQIFAGGEPYWYFVKYEKNLNGALQRLRQEEFNAGRYNPVIAHIDFPINSKSPRPGAKHKSIEEALIAAGADGTRSILDIEKIDQNSDYSVAAPISDEILKENFGTTQPTREMVENSDMGFLNKIKRGHCIYFILYKDKKPIEILFAGYSFD